MLRQSSHSPLSCACNKVLDQDCGVTFRIRGREMIAKRNLLLAALIRRCSDWCCSARAQLEIAIRLEERTVSSNSIACLRSISICLLPRSSTPWNQSWDGETLNWSRFGLFLLVHKMLTLPMTPVSWTKYSTVLPSAMDQLV